MYKDNMEAKGNVKYNRNIVLSVINLATKEIAGVSELCEDFGCAIKKWFSHNYYEGVKISYKDNAMIVDIYINVFYGYNVSEIAYRVQENITNSLSSMIDVKIDRINVHVLGVDFPTEEEEAN